MKKNLLLVALLFLTNSLNAEDDFTSILDEMTQIATKTKLNIDYQPSVVSVVRAEKLRKIGINNLHEALALLPGIETSILHTGWKQVIIRGNYNPDTFIFDKYKLYIDGVDVGSNLYSTNYYYLDFPIELIDRIELLRGSASAVYGPGAFTGAINVITVGSQVNNKNSLFLTTGSYGYIKSGFVQHVQADNWNIGLDSYYQKSDKTIEAGKSFLPTDEAMDYVGDYKRDEYNSLEGFTDFAVGLNAQNEDFRIISRYKAERTQNYYGMNEKLEPVESGYQYNESMVFEAQYKKQIVRDIDIQTKAGVNHFEFTFDTTINDDKNWRLNPTVIQENRYLDLSFLGENFKDHSWILGFNVNRIDTLKNDLGNDYAYTDLSTKTIFLRDDYDQFVKSIYFQDIYSISDNVDISANIRSDDYELFGQMTSYRTGLVYSLNDNNIFKAVYGRSFRAPSYIEAFQEDIYGFKDGNADLNPEVIDTYELAYTHKDKYSIFRTNIFYSELKDVIDIIENKPSGLVGEYANQETDRTSKGIELEYTYQFSNEAEFMTNFSFVRTQYFTVDYDNPVEYASPDISEVLSKGYLLLPVSQRLSFNTAWYYSGQKNGFTRPENSNGTSKDLDATIRVDETLSYSIDKKSTILFCVKNIFNESIRYPSYTNNNDYIEREKRNWQLSYKFKL